MNGGIFVFILQIAFLTTTFGKSCYPHCAAIETIPGPASPNQYTSWLNQWSQWRTQTLSKVKYTTKVYDTMIPWTQTSFMQPQMMAHDLYFYNGTHYTVDKYVADVTSRYGGIDSVLIWHSYPNIGVDDRNQFEMADDMPDGYADAIALLKRKYNISVLLPYNPWDTGTKYIGVGDDVAMNDVLLSTGADGFNGDTLEVVPESFFNVSLNDPQGPAAIEPEEGGDEWSLWYTKLGWGYWTPYPFIPSVDRWRFLEHRRLTHVCERWATDRHDGLQAAFFNGDGYETWENVWGIWNSISERDSAAIMRLGSILRFVGALTGGGNSFSAVDFVPYDPTIIDPQSANTVFATRFQTNFEPTWGALGRPGTLTNKKASSPYAFWSIVNRDSQSNPGVYVHIPVSTSTCFDLYRGIDFRGRPQIDLDEYGYGAILCVPASRSTDPILKKFLGKMQQMTQTPLSSLSTATPVLSQTMVVYSFPYNGGSYNGMIQIPATTSYSFYSTGREIEGQQRPGVDFQYYWETSPQLTHTYTFNLPSFYIDTYPITNSQWLQFVQQSAYTPATSKNYLRDWVGGSYPNGWANKPVTWVSVDDASAYCSWRGGRLPNEWEWQYAAQGNTGQTYPWGNTYDTSRVPTPFKGRTLSPPDDVGSHPTGQSPYGVQDMVGLVWQWTNTFADDHTRAASLKGGSYYQPQGSMWYFPNLFRVYEHGKLLMIGPSLDRSACISLRCVLET